MHGGQCSIIIIQIWCQLMSFVKSWYYKRWFHDPSLGTAYGLSAFCLPDNIWHYHTWQDLPDLLSVLIKYNYKQGYHLHAWIWLNINVTINTEYFATCQWLQILSCKVTASVHMQISQNIAICIKGHSFNESTLNSGTSVKIEPNITSQVYRVTIYS